MLVCKICLWFLHALGEVFEKSYLGSVNSFKLNGYYAAALHDGKICLHLVGFLPPMKV